MVILWRFRISYEGHRGEIQGTIPNDHGSLEEQADSSSSIWAFMNRITGCPKTYPNFEKSKSTIHVNIYIYDVFELGNSSNEKNATLLTYYHCHEGGNDGHFSHHISWEVDTSAERVLDGSQIRNRNAPRSGRWFSLPAAWEAFMKEVKDPWNSTLRV